MLFLFRLFRSLGSIFKILFSWCALVAFLAHLFARAVLYAIALCVDILFAAMRELSPIISFFLGFV